MRIFSTKNVLPRSVGPTTRSENLCRNINSGCALVSTQTSLVNLGLLVILYNAEVFPFLCQLQQFVFVLYFPFACVILWETSGTLIVLYPSLLFDPEKMLLLAIAFFRGSLTDALDAGGHSRRVTLACHIQGNLS